ncbi:MAG: SAVED domain-containing protein [Luteimonas sp.]
MSPVPTRILLIQGISSLRATSEDEAVGALTTDERGLRRQVVALDTREHAEAVASGFWPPVDAQVRAVAAELHANLEEHGPAQLLYAGLDEVPTLIALGALFGDEHRLGCRDYDRDSGRFVWPETAQTLELEPAGAPRERMDAAGEVVVRVEISYPVQDAHVDAVLDRRSRLADVVIRPRGVAPRPGLVRSQADVEHFRTVFRDVLALLELERPGTEVIHLFLAGPVSTCLAAGQELRLRNGRRVQTYRYRTLDDPPLTRALRLTPEASSDVQTPLSDADMALAMPSVRAAPNRKACAMPSPVAPSMPR